MKIWQTARFSRTYKKLPSRSQKRVALAIAKLSSDPLSGEKKSGDLGEFFVHKFREGQKLWLLAYRLNNGDLELIDLGSHENFYRKLRKMRGASVNPASPTDVPK